MDNFPSAQLSVFDPPTAAQPDPLTNTLSDPLKPFAGKDLRLLTNDAQAVKRASTLPKPEPVQAEYSPGDLVVPKAREGHPVPLFPDQVCEVVSFGHDEQREPQGRLPDRGFLGVRGAKDGGEV
ncbi:hypothetical protein QGP82_14745 [Leptothoe sp. LEGE 181152]|nr:hypothetical protein [Leptothoe sp. LEGE 181152]